MHLSKLSIFVATTSLISSGAASVIPAADPNSVLNSATPVRDTSLAPPIPTPKPSSKQSSTDYPLKLIQVNLPWWWIFGDIPCFSTTMYGKHGPCYNIKDAILLYNTGSFKVIGDSLQCWVYREPDCKGDFEEVRKGGGIVIYDGPSPSFICDPPR